MHGAPDPPREPQPPGQQPGQQQPPGPPPGSQGPPGPAYGGPPQPGYGAPPPGYQGPPVPPYGARPALRPDEEKLWAIGAHLGPILLGFIAPLIVWLVYKDRSPWLDRQGKEALNFQLTLLIGYLVSVVLMVVLVGFLLMFAIWVASLVLMIMATVKVANFEDYRYPLTIRFIK